MKKILDRFYFYISVYLSPVINYCSRLTSYYWFNYPFGREPLKTEKEYQRLAVEVQKKMYPEIDHFEECSGHSIDANWLNDLALRTQVVVKQSPLCYAHGRVLYSALSRYLDDYTISRPGEKIVIFETGTARGFSSLCMSKAMHDKKYPGVILTFDVLPHSVPMYWNCITDHTLGVLTREKLLEPWKELLQDYIIFHQGDTRVELQKVKVGRINFAFLDGAHTYKDVMYEFKHVVDRQQPGDIVVYDDYTFDQFPGLVKAVDDICLKYKYKKNILKAHSGRGYVVAHKQ